jgi:hypothetical protein
LDAAGTGTITLGGTSTGKITTDNLVEMFGNVDIGDGATDTLTITSIIDSNVTLDDGVTASPSLIFKDATDETATFSKADTGVLSLTTEANDGLNILTGNLFIGNGSAGTAAMDGEDAYIEGELEVDGATTLDGNLDCNGTLTFSSTMIGANGLTIDNDTNNILEINENSEELLLTFASNIIDFSSGTGINRIDMFDGAASSITKDANGAADDFTLSLTGAQDSSLILSSAGTGADALQISASAGGIDVTISGGAAGEDIDLTTDTSINLVATEAVADQIKLSAQGTVAGNALNLATTDGGIIIAATGAANGDVTVTSGDDMSLTATGTFAASGTNCTIDSSGNADFNANLNTDGKFSVGTPSELTISGGVVTVTASFHNIDTEADAASDDLDTISGGANGQVIYIYANNAGRSVVVKDGTGNIYAAGDFTMDNNEDSMCLIYDGSNWREVSRSDNGA